ncbi:hypothetical protein GO495_28955 [Chitinophaga oryziterrae]|uniref:Novel STAND NTPase 1 domain-containing protein n=1 Tax=Chitinophaga oryziterrae TaxID=1031224 RepID=A0A6N8JHF0_9BACT|nr:NACHT and WD repeat domain-containing protein [Chitinophaga oryziterrae]MVT44657.1 hypothetical protein [Chitinophaga oryziterrae]
MLENPTFDRYPGLRSFNENEQQLFFGRERESYDLHNLICSERLVVLFSKSGIGKSSLLQAGVFPPLRENGYYPIKVRFQYTKGNNEQPTPLEILKDVLLNDEAVTQADIIFDNEKPLLWEICRSVTVNDGKVPVLVFDQFEEFFYSPPEQQNEFLHELAELVHQQPPNRIINKLGEIDIEERTEDQLRWVRQPTYKIVIAIRSDKLYELESVRKYIPLILRNRYQLKPLTIENANKAIVAPAKIGEGKLFQSSQFNFDPVVLTRILHKLAERKSTGLTEVEDSANVHANLEIESSQLQIICKYIEELVIAENKRKWNWLPDNLMTIDDKIFDPDKDIPMVLDNFYANQLSKITTVDKNILRTVLEEHLIAGGNRASLTQNQMKEFLPGDIVDKLLELRLIKEEYTHLGLTYELSHDTLVEPVLRAYEVRKSQDASIKRAAEIQETNRLLLEEQTRNRHMDRLRKEAEEGRTAAKEALKMALKSNKRTVLYLVLIGAFAIIASILFVRSIMMKNRLNENLVQSVQAFGERYYQQNMHHMAFKVWNELFKYGEGIPGVDSIGHLLNKSFFFDISGGEKIGRLDDHHYVVLNTDKTLYLWTVGPANNTVLYEQIGSNAYDLDISDNGGFITYMSGDGQLNLYDVGQRKATIVASENLSKPGFLRNSTILFCSNRENVTRLYDSKRRHLLPIEITIQDIMQMERFKTGVVGILDDNCIGIVKAGRKMVLWNISNTYDCKIIDSTNDVTNIESVGDFGSIVFVKEKNNRKELFICHTSDLSKFKTYRCLITSDISFSGNHSRCRFYDSQGALHIYNLSTNREDTVIKDVPNPRGNGILPRYLSFSYSGNGFLYNNSKNELIFCNTDHNKSMLLPEKKRDTYYAILPNGEDYLKADSSGDFEIVNMITSKRLFKDSLFPDKIYGGRIAYPYYSDDSRMMGYWKQKGDSGVYVVYDLIAKKYIYHADGVRGYPKALYAGSLEWKTDNNQTGIILLNGRPRTIEYYDTLFPPLSDKEKRKYQPQTGFFN